MTPSLRLTLLIITSLLIASLLIASLLIVSLLIVILLITPHFQAIFSYHQNPAELFAILPAFHFALCKLQHQSAL